MKDSEVEWLGRIPAHWSTLKIKHIAREECGAFTDGDWIESPFITDDGIRLIQCGNVGTGRYQEQGFLYISEDTFSALRCSEVIPGDILVCRMRSSPRIRAGRACIAPALGHRMVTAVDNCIIRPRPVHDPEYLVYQMSMSSYLDFVEEVARGGTGDRISRAMLADFALATPPFEEQVAIAKHLNRLTDSIDSLTVNCTFPEVG